LDHFSGVKHKSMELLKPKNEVLVFFFEVV